MTVKKTKEQSVELKYTGTLDGAKTIYLHYGIGENWENVTECKMRKLKSCYKTEVTVPVGTEFNFCFRDTEGNWDNNYGNDYKYSITTNTITPVTNYPTVEVNPYIAKTTKK